MARHLRPRRLAAGGGRGIPQLRVDEDGSRAAGRRAGRRPASSSGRTRSTPSTTSASRSSSPTTCSPGTAPGPSWRCPVRPTRLGLRRGVRPSYRAHRPAAGRLRPFGVPGRRAHDQQRVPRRPERRRRQAQDHRVARGDEQRRRRDHVQAARLAVQSPAVLGRAVPDRVRRDRAPGGASGVDAARRAARDERLPAPHRGRRRGDPARAAAGAAAEQWVTVEADLGEGTKTYLR